MYCHYAVGLRLKILYEVYIFMENTIVATLVICKSIALLILGLYLVIQEAVIFAPIVSGWVVALFSSTIVGVRRPRIVVIRPTLIQHGKFTKR